MPTIQNARIKLFSTERDDQNEPTAFAIGLDIRKVGDVVRVGPNKYEATVGDVIVTTPDPMTAAKLAWIRHMKPEGCYGFVRSAKV